MNWPTKQPKTPQRGTRPPANTSLKRLLPLSHAVQQRSGEAANKALIDEEWMKLIDRSPRKERLHAINPGFNPRKYHKLIKELSRAHSSLLNQFRSNHTALNSYLHRIQRRDNHCTGTKETMCHFALECPEYREARRTTLDTLGRDSRNLQRLLSTSTGIAIFIKFVTASKRFSKRTGVG